MNCSVNKMNLKISDCLFPVGGVNKSGIQFSGFRMETSQNFYAQQTDAFHGEQFFVRCLRCMKVSALNFILSLMKF